MSDLKTKFFLVAAFLLLGGFSAVNAQVTEGTSITLNVPNAFTLRDESFAAGIYTIERTPSTIDSPSLLILRGEDGKSMIFDTMTAPTNKAANSTQLIFDTVGGTTYLTSIVVKGNSGRSDIVKTRTQSKKMAENVAVRNYLTITDSNGL